MHLRLTIDIDYDMPEDADPDALYEQLHAIPRHAADGGMFTGDTNIELTSWKSKVVRFDPNATPPKVAELLAECAEALDVLSEDVEDAGYPARAESATELAMRCRILAAV